MAVGARSYGAGQECVSGRHGSRVKKKNSIFFKKEKKNQ